MIPHPKLYNIKRYTLYYNESAINWPGGVVEYISCNLSEKTEIIVCDKIEILNSCIMPITNNELQMPAVYR